MMKNLFKILFLALFSFKLWAQGLVSAQVQYFSSSEKTVALDVGDLDEFSEGSTGKIFIQRGEYDRPTLFLLGTGKIVKSFSNKSIWLLEKSFIKNRLKVEDYVVILLDGKVARGRKTMFRQKQVVYSNDSYSSPDDFLEQNENNVPDKYIKYRKDFEASEEIFSPEKVAEIEKEFATYDTFKNHGKTQLSDEYADELKGLSYIVDDTKYVLGDLQKAEDRELLESDTAVLMKSANSARLGLLQGKYKSLEKIPGSRDLSKDLSMTSTYRLAKEKEREKREIDPKLQAKIIRDGEMWSADMDDSTLRRYFVTSGIVQEKLRRERVMNELEGHEVMLSYAGTTSAHGVSPDIDPAYQMLGYHLNLAYDLHLSRIKSDLKNWSIQFLAERGINYYSLGSINGRSEEGLYGGYLNYYFENNPLTLNQFIGLVGVGLKFGMSSISADSLSTNYDYQVLTLPSFQLMAKYRIRSGDLDEDTLNVGVSFNAGIIYETKNLRIVNNPSDNIDNIINASDLKYQFGMSLYF